MKVDEEVAQMAMPESVKRDWELQTEQNKAQTRTFISFLLSQQRDEDSQHFKPQTEAQLFERIDRSLAQVEAGDYQDTEEVEAELMAKYGIAE